MAGGDGGGADAVTASVDDDAVDRHGEQLVLELPLEQPPHGIDPGQPAAIRPLASGHFWRSQWC